MIRRSLRHNLRCCPPLSVSYAFAPLGPSRPSTRKLLYPPHPFLALATLLAASGSTQLLGKPTHSLLPCRYLGHWKVMSAPFSVCWPQRQGPSSALLILCTHLFSGALSVLNQVYTASALLPQSHLLRPNFSLRTPLLISVFVFFCFQSITP